MMLGDGERNNLSDCNSLSLTSDVETFDLSLTFQLPANICAGMAIRPVNVGRRSGSQER
jgi:hypothetical protein